MKMIFHKLSLSSLMRIRRAANCYISSFQASTLAQCQSAFPSRHFSSNHSSGSNAQKYYCARLDRSLIRISGPDTFDFLQGLVTNDVHHLHNDSSTSAASRNCIYALMLNTSGRILVDTFIYCLPQTKDELLLEVDTPMLSQVLSTLKRYKIRRKLNIESLNEKHVSMIYPESPEHSSNNNTQALKSNSNILMVPDPRNYSFGYRVICSKAELDNLTTVIANDANFKNISLESSQPDHYRLFRYLNGIGEGMVDFPPESVLPLEANGEILNGVSFQKGCYVGQELTARSYHVGVIRKRLLPIKLLPRDAQSIDWSQPLPVQNVVTEEGKLMGKFRANLRENGLAVLKYAELIGKADAPKIKLAESGIALTTWRPGWWSDNISQTPS